MSPLNITQPLDSIRYFWSTRWLLFQVMSNIPKSWDIYQPLLLVGDRTRPFFCYAFRFSASRCDGIGVDHDSAALVDLQIAGICGWFSHPKYAMPGYPLQFIAMENDGKWWKMMENDGKWWKMMENDGTWWANSWAPHFMTKPYGIIGLPSFGLRKQSICSTLLEKNALTHGHWGMIFSWTHRGTLSKKNGWGLPEGHPCLLQCQAPVGDAVWLPWHEITPEDSSVEPWHTIFL